jgi:hypothetical protein
MRGAARRCSVGLLVALALSPACGGSPAQPTPTPSPAAALTLRLESAHFRMYTDSAPDSVLRSVADGLEAALPRFQADLEVGAMRPVEVRIWQDQSAWQAEMHRYFGRSLQATGYVTGPDGIRVLAVSQVARNASHELAHCVSLSLNPRIANDPRWLWETVAVYENGERVDPHTLSYLVSGQPPTLAELNADVMDSHKVYEVGFLIGEFVVSRGGTPALAGLIRTNGDTQAVLGLSTSGFEQAWYAFVRHRYGL